jgi:hypothetical protein
VVGCVAVGDRHGDAPGGEGSGAGADSPAAPVSGPGGSDPDDDRHGNKCSCPPGCNPAPLFAVYPSKFLVSSQRSLVQASLDI